MSLEHPIGLGPKRPWVLSLLFLLGSCGGSDPSSDESAGSAGAGSTPKGISADTGLERLMVRSNQERPPSPRMIAHCAPDDEGRQWRRRRDEFYDVIDSGKGAIVRIESDTPSNVGVALPLSMDTFDRVDLEVRIPEGEEELLRVTLLRGQTQVLLSGIKPTAGTGAFQRVSFPLPGIERQTGSITDVTMQIGGEASWTEVKSIDVLRQRAAALLPAPGEEPGLVDHGSDARRGWGLDPQVGAIWKVAKTRKEGSARLRFSYATGPELMGAQLSVNGLGNREHVLDLAGETKEWKRFDEPLPQLDLGAEIHFFITANSPSTVGPSALAELHLEVPSESPSGTGADAAPLVLLVTSDTHRGDHLGRGGTGGLVSTPRIDALGRRGVQFTNALAPANMTNPSHVALMTGESPRDTRIVGNQSPLGFDAVTLAERFAAAGWATAAAVSVHHICHPYSGLGQGFDRYDGPEPRTDYRNQRRPGEVAVEKALGWIDERGDQPLFLWVHVFDVHGPYEAEPSYVERYDGQDGAGIAPGLDPVPTAPLPTWISESKEKSAHVRGHHDRYRAAVDQVDALLGRLFDHPRARGPRGIVGLTADHGESFGRHELWWTHHGLYTDQLHVPLIVAGGGLPEGLQTDAPVEMVSLGATLMELAQLDTSEHPAAPLDVHGDRPAEPRYALGYSGEKAAIDHEGWLLMLALRDHKFDLGPRKFVKGEFELYHVETDPTCDLNLADVETERGARMKKALIRWLGDARAEGYATVFNVSEEAVKRLQALGYGGLTDSPNSGAWYVEDE